MCGAPVRHSVFENPIVTVRISGFHIPIRRLVFDIPVENSLLDIRIVMFLNS